MLLLRFKNAGSLGFTLMRKYSQQLIINADKQGASKSREHITSISGRFSAFLLCNKMLFLRADIYNLTIYEADRSGTQL